MQSHTSALRHLLRIPEITGFARFKQPSNQSDRIRKGFNTLASVTDFAFNLANLKAHYICRTSDLSLSHDTLCNIFYSTFFFLLQCHYVTILVCIWRGGLGNNHQALCYKRLKSPAIDYI